jgi:hypothetical protein
MQAKFCIGRVKVLSLMVKLAGRRVHVKEMETTFGSVHTLWFALLFFQYACLLGAFQGMLSRESVNKQILCNSEK